MISMPYGRLSLTFRAHATATCRIIESSEFFIFFVGKASREAKNRISLIPKRFFFHSYDGFKQGDKVNRFLLRLRKKAD
jgi:hypothetical protein